MPRVRSRSLPARALKALALLRELRTEVDAIDADLVRLLGRRARVVAAIAALKREMGLPPRDLRREREILRSRVARARAAGVSATAARAVFAALLGRSRAAGDGVPDR